MAGLSKVHGAGTLGAGGRVEWARPEGRGSLAWLRSSTLRTRHSLCGLATNILKTWKASNLKVTVSRECSEYLESAMGGAWKVSGAGFVSRSQGGLGVLVTRRIAHCMEEEVSLRRGAWGLV